MAAPILVSGLINVETTLRIDGFPLAYNPVNYPFFGVNSSVSGVGYNVAKALTVLANPVRFCSLIGRDLAGGQVRAALTAAGIDDRYVRDELDATAQSVILYDADGRRQIHTDLKDIQDHRYPPERFTAALQGCALAVLCNVNFSRALLPVVQQAGVPIATDVHAISDLDDPYNAGFMAAADILFMSDDLLPVAPEEWAEAVIARYGPRILVIGLGAAGALLAVPGDGFVERLPAFAMSPSSAPSAQAMHSSPAFSTAFIRTRRSLPIPAYRDHLRRPQTPRRLCIGRFSHRN